MSHCDFSSLLNLTLIANDSNVQNFLDIELLELDDFACFEFDSSHFIEEFLHLQDKATLF